MSSPQKSTPVQVTLSTGNDQLLYFTSTSLLSGKRGLVFISDRTGHPNLFFADFKTGGERQLSRNTEGHLKSYVYFDGTPYRGFGKASISLDPDRGMAYYLQGREIRAVDTEGRERTLAELPRGQMTAFTHVSADGRRLCVPTVDARALNDDQPKGDYSIDGRVQSEGLSSYLRVYDTSTGREIQTVAVPRAWITHVQFSPANPNLILYNHEWPGDEAGIRRMWLWDGSRHLQLRQEDPGIFPPRSRKDWACHEMWERDGSAIIYHGGYSKETPGFEGVPYLGRVRPDGTGVSEIVFPPDWKQYGHFTVGHTGQLITDGYYRTETDPHTRGGCWLTLLKVDWAQGKIDWQPLARHGSSWVSQDDHPHPIINDTCDAVYFTSDRNGKRAVYRLDI